MLREIEKSLDPLVFKNRIRQELSELILQKNYPCVAAVKALKSQEIQIEVYDNFGEVGSRFSLRNDLLRYIDNYKKNPSSFLTFCAVFSDAVDLSEEEFELRLWKELSSLTSEETRSQDQDPEFSSDPKSKNFCFCLGGKAFFVVGLHSQSSRLARRFPWPTLIFNVYEQFKKLSAAGLYENMVKINRQRDMIFQGNINPMAQRHGESWESIQYSGKANPENWQCPFHFKNSSSQTLK